MSTDQKIIIYTDGACSGNPGPGGWGAYLVYKSHQKEIYGMEAHTTNNRMEIMAAIKALEALKQPCDVELYTDSVYLKNGITTWIHNWIKKDWRTGKSLVKNVDLWQTLYQYSNKHNIDWHWVKGHSTNKGNQAADRLATQGRDEAKKSMNIQE
ncbi:MAG: ribonuclease HI [Pseudomonadota bacterium]